MGDRANVKFVDGDHPVYFYTHWAGTELPKTVAAALRRGRDRWDDGQYLARIVFCEMVGADRGTTGYGISTYLGDGGRRIVTVDVFDSSVSVGGNTWTFIEYIELDEPSW